MALASESLIGSVTGLNSAAAGTALHDLTGNVEFWDSLNSAAAHLVATQALAAGAGHIGVYDLRTKLAAGTNTLTLHYIGDTGVL